MRDWHVANAPAVLLGAMDTGGTAASADSRVTHVVQNFTVSPDSMCGFSGTSQIHIDFTIVPIGRGRDDTSGKFVQTFTADNGRGVIITFDAGVFKSSPEVVYSDGSSSVTSVEDGASAITRAVQGPLLQQSTGRLTSTVFFDANGNFVNIVVTPLSGPQNNTTGAPDCSVVGPYLAG